MDPLESSSSGWWALRGYPAYWTCQEQTKATAQLHTGHVVVPVRLYLSAVPFPDLICMIYPSSACSRGLDWLLCASQQDEQMCWCPVQRAVLLSPSPFCFPLQAKVEASGHISTRTCVSSITQPAASPGSACPGGGWGTKYMCCFLGW